jgi:hypothetical protein
MQALLRGPSISVDGAWQLWRWTLPDLALRRRDVVTLGRNGEQDPDHVVLSATDGLLRVDGGEPLTARWSDQPPRSAQPLASGAQAQHSGARLAVTAPDGDAATVEVLRPRRQMTRALEAEFTVRFRDATSVPRITQHGDVTTVFDELGRIVAVEDGTRRIVANLVVRD